MNLLSTYLFIKSLRANSVYKSKGAGVNFSMFSSQSGHLKMNEKQGIYRIRLIEDLLVRQFVQKYRDHVDHKPGLIP